MCVEVELNLATEIRTHNRFYTLMEKISGEFPIDADAILNRISEARGLSAGWGRDSALARAFQISSKRVSAWRERNTLDHLLIIHHCRQWGLNINWVYYGEGPPEAMPTPPDNAAILHA